MCYFSGTKRLFALKNTFTSTILIVLTLMLPPAAGAQIPFTRLTGEDGLGNNSVQCILQDKQGIMWIGTNGGLDRYDGAAFIQYGLLSRPALSSNVITALLEDEAGNIWIGTENGLNILDPVANTIRSQAQSILPASAQSILPVSVQSTLPASALSAAPIRSLQKMQDGSIWIISETQVVKYTPHDGFRKVRLDGSLLGTTKVFTGLSQNIDHHSWMTYLDQPAAQAVHYTLPDGTDSLGAAGRYWPGCSRAFTDSLHQDWGISCFGVTRFDKGTGLIEPWLKNKIAQKIPDLHLYTCYCADAEGNIWEGSTQLNLVKYDLQHRQVTDYNGLLRSCNATMVFCI